MIRFSFILEAGQNWQKEEQYFTKHTKEFWILMNTKFSYISIS